MSSNAVKSPPGADVSIESMLDHPAAELAPAHRERASVLGHEWRCC